jgi:hypothetical protein
VNTCEDCKYWETSERQESAGTCRHVDNMVFFGIPEAEDRTPNMHSMTWSWDTCSLYEPNVPPRTSERVAPASQGDTDEREVVSSPEGDASQG